MNSLSGKLVPSDLFSSALSYIKCRCKYAQNLVQLNQVIIVPDIPSTDERGLELKNSFVLEVKCKLLINGLCETKRVQSHQKNRTYLLIVVCLSLFIFF